ncbi:hypothetical protein C7999DRAFT_26974 [Corynascus novoguineensis]|uniref:PNPLA domain-containing protein n=1 Tax=Corynascus novoguineensis TaxID=1126955 RepID=A0AAN7D5F5_9PEZI|nr:hypothetical protein C7999DRAFT_26974 [Corynascus novoguineensis]
MWSTEPDNDEAINLLSLDGGGVRGVSSLVVLDGIMRKIKDMYGLSEVPKPCEFFHMIAGTSTGGLIAIMLGRLRMSTKEALEEYDNCAEKIFSKSNHKSWSLSEKFRATALQEAIEGIVKKRGLGESMRDPEEPRKGKAFVCVMPSDNIGEVQFVRSFAGDEGSLDNWDEDVLIWEAARATTAASSFFKPQKLGRASSAREYIDAAIGVNNPVSYLLPEAVKEFGSGRRLGCVVSIGTGTRDVKLDKSVGGLKSILKFRGVVFYAHLIKTLKDVATGAEISHQQLESRFLNFPGAYYRFNVPQAAAQVKLHHYLKIPELKILTEKYLSTETVAKQVRQLARALKTDGFDHGLTLGHIHDLDTEQILLSGKKIRSMRVTSNFFTGREDILKTLDSYFAPRSTGGSPRREFLLHGVGGVGKTEIAFKISEMLGDRLVDSHTLISKTPRLTSDRFEYVFYIDGSTPATIVQSYANIARQHGMTGAMPDELCAKCKRWMERLTEEWLMIFDDCNLSDRQGHLPGRGKGNIIYTSRMTSLEHNLPVECTYEVVPLGEKDAIDLLSKASGFPENLENKKCAEAIVQELECLPLAIEKAAAFIRDGDYSLQEYLKRFRAEKVRILSNPGSDDEDEDIKKAAVHATLELSYQAIAARRRREGRHGRGRVANFALKLLNLFSFFHHKEIPSLIMQRAAEEHHSIGAPRHCPLSHLMNPYDYDLELLVRVKADGRWDSTDFAAGVTILRKFSLVKVSPDKRSLSMHALVHAWARKRMDKPLALRWALVARVLLVESLRGFSRVDNLQYSRSLAPHFDVCLAVNPPLEPIRDQYRAHLLQKLGEYHRTQKRFLDARDCFWQSLQIWRVETGPDSWAAISVARSLARLYHEMGSLSDAEFTFLEAIVWLRARDDDKRADLGLKKPTPEPVGGSSKAQMKRQVRQLMEKLSEPPVGGVLSGKSSQFWSGQSKTEGRVKRYEPNMPDDSILAKGRKLTEQLGELEMIDMAHSLMHGELALVYLDQDRYRRGKRMLLKAVELLEQQLEKYDPDYMKLQIEARTLTDAGNREFWERYMDDVLQAPREATLQFWQSETSFDLIIAAIRSLLMDDPEKWDSACRELLGLWNFGAKWLDSCDRKILKISRYVVECLILGQKYDLAMSLARICLSRARSAYGESHMETIQSYVTLCSAVFHYKMELDQDMVALLQEAVQRARAGLGSSHSVTRNLEDHLNHFREEEVATTEEPILETADPEVALMESWRRSKESLEKSKAELGANHPIIKRLELMLGDGPARTKEELLERAQAFYGSNNSRIQTLEREVEEEKNQALVALDPEGAPEQASAAAPPSSASEEPSVRGEGKDLEQPREIINKMANTGHAALSGKFGDAETRPREAARAAAIDDLVRNVISEWSDGGLKDAVHVGSGGDTIGSWMSGNLQPQVVM